MCFALTATAAACPVYFYGIRKVGKTSLLNRVVVDLLATGRRVDLFTAQG